MRKRIAEVLHVVVGAGNVSYFLNAIRSLQELRAGDVYAAYNFLDEADRKAISSQECELGDVVGFDLRQNIPTSRTGSLYEANNAALGYARNKYEFVSFLQADMQVMWWDSKILSKSRALLASVGDGGEASFYTQLPILGKHPRPYERWTRDDKLGVYKSHGHVDVCLMPIFGRFNSEFFFDGTEKEMSRRRSAEAATLFLHPFPYVAPIPFPSTLRDRGRTLKGNPKKTVFPILRVREDFVLDFQADQAHPVTMEHSVRPNGWSCLFPYWPSDTFSRLWFVRRLEFSRLHGQGLFAVVTSKGRIRSFPLSIFAPGWKAIYLALFSAVAQKLISVLPRSSSKRKAQTRDSKGGSIF